MYISSPAGGRGRNSSPHSARQAVRSALLDYPTPSKKQTVGGRAFSPSTSSKSSLNSDRLRQNWRSTENSAQPPKQAADSFVQRSGNVADDVFSSTNDDSQQPVQGKLVCTLSMGKHALSVELKGPLQANEKIEAISNDNAQALLPPSACVFVAKYALSIRLRKDDTKEFQSYPDANGRTA